MTPPTVTPRGQAFMLALGTHFDTLHPALVWYLSADSTSLGTLARVRHKPFDPSAWHPFREGGYIQVNWCSGTHINLSFYLHSITPVDATESHTFNLDDPPSTISNFVERMSNGGCPRPAREQA